MSNPIDFEAVDGRPVDIVFLLLAPTTPESDQLNALACIARKLMNAEVVSRYQRALASWSPRGRTNPGLEVAGLLDVVAGHLPLASAIRRSIGLSSRQRLVASGHLGA